MLSNRKLRWSLLFGTFAMIFAICGYLYVIYLVSSFFFDADRADMLPPFLYSVLTIILFLLIIYFFSLPLYRIDFQFNNLHEKIVKLKCFDNMQRDEISVFEVFKRSTNWKIASLLIFLFAMLNFIMALISFNNVNHLKLMIHMAAIIIADLAYVSYLLSFKIDLTFKKFEEIILKLNKDKTTEEQTGDYVVDDL